MALATGSNKLVFDARRGVIAGVHRAVIAIALAWMALGVAHTLEGSGGSRSRQEGTSVIDAPVAAASSSVVTLHSRAHIATPRSRLMMPSPHSVIAVVGSLESQPHQLSRGTRAAQSRPAMTPRRLRGYDAAAPPVSSLL